jgi:mannose-6-phosphate isomerase
VAGAAAHGTLEDLLVQVPVTRGEMVFVDAGTVHAIGPGVVLLEVQQTCDVTYRLFDYGRGRDLHLEEGLAVIQASTMSGKVESIPAERFTRLIKEKYFVVDRFDLPANAAIEMEMDGIGCVAGIAGSGAVNEVTFEVGQAVVVPVGSVTLTSRDGCSFVRCWEPEK